MSLGLGVGVDTTGIIPNRRNTYLPSDFAYWASTFIADGKPADYNETGPIQDAVELVSWSASQVGLVDFPATYPKIITYCASGIISVSEALQKRGALLFNGEDIAVTLGLQDILTNINGRFFIIKPTIIQLNDWVYGALIPGLEY